MTLRIGDFIVQHIPNIESLGINMTVSMSLRGFLSMLLSFVKGYLCDSICPNSVLPSWYKIKPPMTSSLFETP